MTRFAVLLAATPVLVDAIEGEARVEVFEVVEEQEHDGPRTWERIEAFALKKCVPVTGDVHGAPVAWDGASWAQLKGRLVALRVHLRNATLYSFWTRTEPGRDVVVNLTRAPPATH